MPFMTCHYSIAEWTSVDVGTVRDHAEVGTAVDTRVYEVIVCVTPERHLDADVTAGLDSAILAVP